MEETGWMFRIHWTQAYLKTGSETRIQIRIHLNIFNVILNNPSYIWPIHNRTISAFIYSVFNWGLIPKISFLKTLFKPYNGQLIELQ